MRVSFFQMGDGRGESVPGKTSGQTFDTTAGRYTIIEFP